MKKYTYIASSLLALSLVACSTPKIDNSEEIVSKRDRKYKDMDKLFGDEALVFGGEQKRSDRGEVGIGVNSYLWRASLDTIAFMPLKSADPFGGVILTSWYTPPQTPEERLKINILILGRQLRADGVKVSVFRQKYMKGQWIDQTVDPQTATELENTILTRARQMRIDSGK